MTNRSANMRANRSKDTSPELRLRKALHTRGLRYRLHVKELPGKPDIVLPSRQTVVFVHGCFWHQHRGCKLANIPRQRVDYWGPKLARNVERDATHQRALEASGWRVVTVWECQTRKDLELRDMATSIQDLPVQKKIIAKSS
jgi:DNA mismatch endonuclease (patch repair protein)